MIEQSLSCQNQFKIVAACGQLLTHFRLHLDHEKFPFKGHCCSLVTFKINNCGVKEASGKATVTTALGSVGFKALKPLSLSYTRAVLILPVAAALLGELGRNVISKNDAPLIIPSRKSSWWRQYRCRRPGALAGAGFVRSQSFSFHHRPVCGRATVLTGVGRGGRNVRFVV